MKKLLIALLMLIGAVAFAPKAEAGQYAKVWNGHCYTYVHKSRVHGSNWDCAPGSRGYHQPSHSRYSRSSRVYYSRPAYYSRPVRSYRSYDRCDRPVRYSSGPRFAVSFGF